MHMSWDLRNEIDGRALVKWQILTVVVKSGMNERGSMKISWYCLKCGVCVCVCVCRSPGRCFQNCA